jgi:hypothetical protein
VLPWNKAVYYYQANAIPPESPYLLHENGIKDGGTPVRRREDIHMLFACAGVTDAKAKHVLIKVSGCEGGFDAINTWDTGYVSVGFIQFITGETGTGNSLIRVLARMKADEQRISKQRRHVNEFDRYFAGHGVDVRDDQLYVRDPCTGQVLTGAAAVQLIIDDKRLTAIFQDAGAKSRAFQLAQIREAYGAYYLADAPFRIPAVEISVYRVDDTASSAPDIADGQMDSGSAENIATAAHITVTPSQHSVRLVKTSYAYGQEAVQQALAGTLAPGDLPRRAAASPSGTILRVARRLPSLCGTYQQALPSEGAQVTLTDRAVQHGVRSAMASFASGVNALAPDHPLTLADLREHQDELVMLLKNRIDVLASNRKASQAVVD